VLFSSEPSSQGETGASSKLSLESAVSDKSANRRATGSRQPSVGTSPKHVTLLRSDRERQKARDTSNTQSMSSDDGVLVPGRPRQQKRLSGTTGSIPTSEPTPQPKRRLPLDTHSSSSSKEASPLSFEPTRLEADEQRRQAYSTRELDMPDSMRIQSTPRVTKQPDTKEQSKIRAPPGSSLSLSNAPMPAPRTARQVSRGSSARGTSHLPDPSGFPALHPVRVPAPHVFAPYLPRIESGSSSKGSPIGSFSSQNEASGLRPSEPPRGMAEDARGAGRGEHPESDQGAESRQASIEGPILDDFLHPDAFAPPTGQVDRLAVQAVAGGAVRSEPSEISYFVDETPDPSVLTEASKEGTRSSFPPPNIKSTRKRDLVGVNLLAGYMI
jgi:hypothetical protein